MSVLVPARVLITLVVHHPCHPTRTLKAAYSGEHHTKLGADFCLLRAPRIWVLTTPDIHTKMVPGAHGANLPLRLGAALSRNEAADPYFPPG